MRSVGGSIGRDPAVAGWREGVQRAMLRLAAFVAPPIVLAAVLLRSGSWTRLDTVVISGVGILVPLCGMIRGPLATRALLLLLTAFAVTCYFLGRNGLVAGISVALITLTILASLSAGRSLGMAFILIALAANVCVGVLAQRHVLTINTAASDPLVLRNWIRIGGI